MGRTIHCRCGKPVLLERATKHSYIAADEVHHTHREERERRTRRVRKRREATVTTPGVPLTARVRLPRSLRHALRAIGHRFADWRRDLQSRHALIRYTSRAAAAYLVSAVASWMTLILLSERWLPATLLAYGPRVLLLTPALVLFPAAALWSRRSLPALVTGALVVLFPVMGLRVAMSMSTSIPPATVADNTIRVLSLNAQGGFGVAQRLSAIIAAYTPQVMTFQECGEGLAQELARRSEWYVSRYGGLCTASRWPIGLMDSMPRAAFERVRDFGYGGSGMVVRYSIVHPSRPFHLVNLHLETPRKGLQSLLGDDGFIPDEVRGMVNTPRDGSRLSLNALIRNQESERASVWSSRTMNAVPLIVAGDFNLPVESSIYREYWRGLINAFSTSGHGFGFTKREGALLRIRIDHVLSAPQWFDVQGAWVGMDVGSDHRPMIADLQFTSYGAP